MKVYHATNYDNLSSIIVNGLEPSGEGIFLAEGFEQALACTCFRNYSVIIVLELEIDESELRESFNHNENRFCKLFGLESCKAWVHEKPIPAYEIDLEKARLYDMRGGK